MSHADVQILLRQLKSAVEQPRLYVYQFFEKLKNGIDIQYQTELMVNNEERLLKHQALLIGKIEERKRLFRRAIRI